MKKIFILIILIPTTILGATLKEKENKYNYFVSKITPTIKERMINGNSWKKECPIKLEDLRYIKLSYWDFNNIEQTGEIIVHKELSDDVVDIFKEFYDKKYLIYSLKLVSDFKADDNRSMAANNSSAFNCRKVAGTKSWSNHTYGRAIDINPVQNPYIRKNGAVEPENGKKYVDRKVKHHAIIRKNDLVYNIFKKYNWFWGGNWRTVKDYQHFQKKRKLIKK